MREPCSDRVVVRLHGYSAVPVLRVEQGEPEAYSTTYGYAIRKRSCRTAGYGASERRAVSTEVSSVQFIYVREPLHSVSRGVLIVVVRSRKDERLIFFLCM